MAAQVTVINTSFQRLTLKVTPGTYLSDVIQEACEKWGVKPANYLVKNNKKTLDLSQTWRQSNLTPGAKLELVLASKSPSVVTVGLRVADLKVVPDGRLVDKFQSTTTFWLILRQFESREGLNLNFTSRGVAQTDNGSFGAGRIVYETPVLNISGREISSFTDMQKTLAQLGFNSGTCSVRLHFRKTDTPLEVATAEIREYFKSAEGQNENNASPSVILEPNAVSFESSSTESNLAPLSEREADGPSQNLVSTVTANATPGRLPEVSPADKVVLGPNKRPISVYAPPSGDTPKAALQPHSEADYEPTIAHAKLHQSRLQTNSYNRRLLSDAELQQQEKDKAAKQAAIKEVSVKIRFPDQSQTVSSFTPTDSGASLYSFARGVIAAKDEPFTMVWTSSKGPQMIPDNDKTTLISGLGFSGRMLVNFNWGDAASQSARDATVLSPEFASKAQEIPVQEISTAATEEEVPRVALNDNMKDKEKEGGGNSKGIPKWLKLGKK